jgi:hypothetical protein
MYLLLTPRLLTVIDSEGVLIKEGEFIADRMPPLHCGPCASNVLALRRGMV